MCPSILETLIQVATSFALAQFKKAGVCNIRIAALQNVMASGNLELVKTAIELFSFTPEEIRSIDVFAWCSRPSKELVQWWVKTCEPSKADLVKLFGRLCLCGGMADTARDLATQCNFTKDDLLSVDKIPYALLGACRRGDLELVKWMIETYDFTLDDIKNCNILDNACANRTVMQYLISHFNFDRDTAIKAFYTACSWGDLALVKSLANLYQYTLSEVREKNTVLINCDGSDVREWLLDTYYKDITSN